MVRILDAAANAGARCWSWMCTWETDLAKLRSTHAIELMFLWGWADDPDMPDMRRFAGAGRTDRSRRGDARLLGQLRPHRRAQRLWRAGMDALRHQRPAGV